MKLVNEISPQDKWKQVVTVEMTLEEVAVIYSVIGGECANDAQPKVDRYFDGIELKGAKLNACYTLYRGASDVLQQHGITRK